MVYWWSTDPARFVDWGFWFLRKKEAQEYKSSSQETNHNMGPSPATVCPIMWVNQAQAWDDGYCTRPVLRISGAEEEILRVPRPGHAEKLPKGVIVPGIYNPHKGTSERIEALSLGDTGNEVIVVADWELFSNNSGRWPPNHSDYSELVRRSWKVENMWSGAISLCPCKEAPRW